MRWRRDRFLEESYKLVCSEPSDIVNHLPRFVELVKELDAKHVIELGTRTGVSTIAWLYGLEETGGRLTSVDIDPKPDIGEFDHWTFIRGSDLDPTVLAKLDPCDICFIDTSHIYEQTVQELAVYRWLVNPGGVICCHDTLLERPEGAPIRPRFPVRVAISEFVNANGFDCMEYSDSWGLAVIKVV